MSLGSRFTFHVSRITFHGSGITDHASRITRHQSSITNHQSPTTNRAFTLIELLVVTAIMALLAALSGPIISIFRPNIVDAADRQLLDDLARARKFAISQRTTVYMVFVPTNFWNDPATNTWTTADWRKAANLFDKQLIGYNFVTLSRLGDQPGERKASYLGPWKTLPESVFIAQEKFIPRPKVNNPNLVPPVLSIFKNVPPSLDVLGFNTTNNIPFPAEDTLSGPGNVYVTLPYIAFNYLGQLTDSTTPNKDELIPLSKGSILFQPGVKAIPSIRESPPGNVTNAFNVVSIDWLTGRAHLERPQVQ